MCGIAGIFSPGQHRAELESWANCQARAILSRGPDDSGVWVDPVPGIALAHRRLSILDLSSAGHQPMLSATGRFVITYNGEIYNHLAIRRELDQSQLCRGPWRGYSDTETLLAAIEAWGLVAALQRCVGMFALALWDRHERVLLLARDRFGEKPLYWGLSGSGSVGSVPSRAILFGSELSALRAWPGFSNPIDRQSLAQLLRFGAIAAPRSIHAGIQQLPPGHLLRLSLGAGLPEQLPESEPWWCLRSTIASGLRQPFTDQHDALEALERCLSEAVQLQSLSDVPLGAFLSGGIDSSLITALLQAQSGRPVRTFTIAFEEAGFNEAPYARAVAAHLGTDHNETLLTSADAQALIPLQPRHGRRGPR